MANSINALLVLTHLMLMTTLQSGCIGLLINGTSSTIFFFCVPCGTSVLCCVGKASLGDESRNRGDLTWYLLPHPLTLSHKTPVFSEVSRSSTVTIIAILLNCWSPRNLYKVNPWGDSSYCCSFFVGELSGCKAGAQHSGWGSQLHHFLVQALRQGTYSFWASQFLHLYNRDNNIHLGGLPKGLEIMYIKSLTHRSLSSVASVGMTRVQPLICQYNLFPLFLSLRLPTWERSSLRSPKLKLQIIVKDLYNHPVMVLEIHKVYWEREWILGISFCFSWIISFLCSLWSALGCYCHSWLSAVLEDATIPTIPCSWS